jgi:hypothetical protein
MGKKGTNKGNKEIQKKREADKQGTNERKKKKKKK